MKKPSIQLRLLAGAVVLLFCTVQVSDAQDTYSAKFTIEVDQKLADEMSEQGRLFIFLNEELRGQPRTQLWPFNELRNYIFARNITWEAGKPLKVNSSDDWDKTGDFDFNNIPAGEYALQVLWDQNTSESSVNASGNLYSEVLKVDINENSKFNIKLTEAVESRELVDHDHVKLVELVSDTLSSWWGKPVTVKASVLLPSGYFEDNDKTYPVRYNVAGYGGRYYRVNRMVRAGSDFNQWWMSGDAPQVINVFLDGEGPFGDSYQLDSENSGPYGYSLIHELIPLIEETYRGAGTAEKRFVDGCSTGGWVSFALQVLYPDHFNGAFSYSPDAIEFENYQTINIYEDDNAFVNQWGNARPVMRDISGNPMIVMERFIQYENVQGRSGTYVTSGGQFSAHTALYSPKGEDGLPKPLFDPFTGAIDKEVAEHWKKYDLKVQLEENWEELGPKLHGKLWVWMGDMDQFLLNPASRAMDEFLAKQTNPTSDATFVFEAMQGHCSGYSHREVLEMIDEKLNER